MIRYVMPKKSVLCFLTLGAMGMCLAAWNCGAQTNSTNNANSGPTYESFQIITRNNIFDPNRSRYIPGGSQQVRRRPVNRFSLVGTMSYPKGKFAFFDSPNADYKKVLEPGASIAGYIVKDVTNTGVTLAANGKELEMKVGTQMTRNEGESNWHLSGRVEQEAENTDTTNQATDAQTPSAPPTGATPEMSDTLKRLMQQREQELK